MQDALTHSGLILCNVFSAQANEIPATSCHMYLAVYTIHKAVRTNLPQPKMLDTFLERRLNRFGLWRRCYSLRLLTGNQRSLHYSSLAIKSRWWDSSVPLGHLWHRALVVNSCRSGKEATQRLCILGLLLNIEVLCRLETCSVL